MSFTIATWIVWSLKLACIWLQKPLLPCRGRRLAGEQSVAKRGHVMTGPKYNPLTVAEREFEVTTVPDLLTFNIMVATLVYGRIQQPLASGCPPQILLRTLARNEILDELY